MDKEIDKMFNIIYTMYSKEGYSVKKMYNQILRLFFQVESQNNDGSDSKVSIPTEYQFQHWLQKNKQNEKDVIDKMGERKYTLNNRATLSDSLFQTMGPGFRYQVDATKADVWLVNSVHRKRLIGRPIVYIAVDVFSHLIVGLHVCLKGPSREEVSTLLFNCFEDKVSYCKKYDIDIEAHEWPSAGIPKTFLADRGEIISRNNETVVKNLDINFEYTPTGRGDAKGLVEQYFHRINTDIKDPLPGKGEKEFRDRGDRDYRYDAKLNIHEFTKIMIAEIIKRNNRRIDPE